MSGYICCPTTSDKFPWGTATQSCLDQTNIVCYNGPLAIFQALSWDLVAWCPFLPMFRGGCLHGPPLGLSLLNEKFCRCLQGLGRALLDSPLSYTGSADSGPARPPRSPYGVRHYGRPRGSQERTWTNVFEQSVTTLNIPVCGCMMTPIEFSSSDLWWDLRY